MWMWSTWQPNSFLPVGSSLPLLTSSFCSVCLLHALLLQALSASVPFHHDCRRTNRYGLPRSPVCPSLRWEALQVVNLALIRTGKGQLPLSTRVILSHHDYKRTPDSSTLEKLMEDMFASGADVAKIATTAEHIQDAARVLALPRKASRKASCHLGWFCNFVT